MFYRLSYRGVGAKESAGNGEEEERESEDRLDGDRSHEAGSVMFSMSEAAQPFASPDTKNNYKFLKKNTFCFILNIQISH